MSLNLIPLALLAGFAVWEVLANWRFVPATRTMSEIVWDFEATLGWPGRALIGALVALLFTHLVFRVPQ